MTGAAASSVIRIRASSLSTVGVGRSISAFALAASAAVMASGGRSVTVVLPDDLYVGGVAEPAAEACAGAVAGDAGEPAFPLGCGAQLQDVRPGLGVFFAQGGGAVCGGGEDGGDAQVGGGGAAAEWVQAPVPVAAGDGFADGGVQGLGHR